MLYKRLWDEDEEMIETMLEAHDSVCPHMGGPLIGAKLDEI